MSQAQTTSLAPPAVEPPPVAAPIAGQGHTPNPASSHVPVHFARRTGWRVLIFVLIAVAGLAGAYLFYAHQRRTAAADLAKSTQQDQERPPTVTAAKVESADADAALTLPGECRALIETTVFARVSGYVRDWKYDIGDHVDVNKNKVLLTLDTPELDEQIKVAQAKVASLKAEVKLAQAALDFAKLTSERFQAGAPGGAVSQQEADQKKSEMDVCAARLESANAQVDLGEAEVRRLLALQAFRCVAAPFSGTVTQRHIDIGDLVTAGSTTNTTPLFTISCSDKVRVFVDVPQNARTSIHVGMAANVNAREFPGRSFDGVVDRTSEAINPNSGTLRVQVLVPNPQGELLPGMYALVTFRSRRDHPPVRIQASALMLLADGPHVAVIGSDGHVHFRAIKFARDLGDVIEVAEGLAGDESVVLNISHEIVDGQKVTPVVAGGSSSPQSTAPPDRDRTAKAAEAPAPGGKP